MLFLILFLLCLDGSLLSQKINNFLSFPIYRWFVLAFLTAFSIHYLNFKNVFNKQNNLIWTSFILIFLTESLSLFFNLESFLRFIFYFASLGFAIFLICIKEKDSYQSKKYYEKKIFCSVILCCALSLAIFFIFPWWVMEDETLRKSFDGENPFQSMYLFCQTGYLMKQLEGGTFLGKDSEIFLPCLLFFFQEPNQLALFLALSLPVFIQSRAICWLIAAIGCIFLTFSNTGIILLAWFAFCYFQKNLRYSFILIFLFFIILQFIRVDYAKINKIEELLSLYGENLKALLKSPQFQMIGPSFNGQISSTSKASLISLLAYFFWLGILCFEIFRSCKNKGNSIYFAGLLLLGTVKSPHHFLPGFLPIAALYLAKSKTL